VIDALGALEPVWDELYPAKQVRILRLLIERIHVAPDGISVTLRAAGIRTGQVWWPLRLAPRQPFLGLAAALLAALPADAAHVPTAP
jgi:hypothetical protein